MRPSAAAMTGVLCAAMMSIASCTRPCERAAVNVSCNCSGLTPTTGIKSFPFVGNEETTGDAPFCGEETGEGATDGEADGVAEGLASGVAEGVALSLGVAFGVGAAFGVTVAAACAAFISALRLLFKRHR